MDNIKLYRKRYIPNEMILLKDDIILSIDQDKIITKWDVLKARKDFNRGYSCYFINDSIKVSKFYKGDKLIYTYCDIIETDFSKEANSYTFNDLLIDVIIYEDGFVKVMDMDEIADALDENIITIEQAKKALRVTDTLLNDIYSKKFFDTIECMNCLK